LKKKLSPEKRVSNVRGGYPMNHFDKVKCIHDAHSIIKTESKARHLTAVQEANAIKAFNSKVKKNWNRISRKKLSIKVDSVLKEVINLIDEISGRVACLPRSSTDSIRVSMIINHKAQLLIPDWITGDEINGLSKSGAPFLLSGLTGLESAAIMVLAELVNREKIEDGETLKVSRKMFCDTLGVSQKHSSAFEIRNKLESIAVTHWRIIAKGLRDTQSLYGGFTELYLSSGTQWIFSRINVAVLSGIKEYDQVSLKPFQFINMNCKGERRNRLLQAIIVVLLEVVRSSHKRAIKRPLNEFGNTIKFDKDKRDIRTLATALQRAEITFSVEGKKWSAFTNKGEK
jgi:hypothetical protein